MHMFVLVVLVVVTCSVLSFACCLSLLRLAPIGMPSAFTGSQARSPRRADSQPLQEDMASSTRFYKCKLDVLNVTTY